MSAHITEAALELAQTIPVTRLPKEELRTRAKRECSSLSLTDRAVVNYIRHRLSPYDKLMSQSREDRSGFEQRDIFRRAVLLAIAKTYADSSEIVEEAKRQFAEKSEVTLHRTRANVWHAVQSKTEN
jgi:hypothetical protein